MSLLSQRKPMKTRGRKLTWILGMVSSIFLTNSTFGQTEEPYQEMPVLTMDTNGATFLADHSQQTDFPSPGGPPLIPNSPATAIDFQGLTDNNASYPLDTHGAVGKNHVVTMLNTQVRVLTRGGATITTMTLSNFWSSANI